MISFDKQKRITIPAQLLKVSSICQGTKICVSLKDKNTIYLSDYNDEPPESKILGFVTLDDKNRFFICKRIFNFLNVTYDSHFLIYVSDKKIFLEKVN